MQIANPIRPGSHKPLKLALCCTALLCLGQWSVLGVSDQVTDWLSDEVKFSQGKLHLGIFDIRPRLSGSMVYDDNIYIQSANKQSDVVWVLSPGLAIGAGDYRVDGDKLLKLDYAPSFLFFQRTTQNDSIDHNGNLSARWQVGRLGMSLQQQLLVSSGGYFELGNRVQRHIYTTSLLFKYELGGKTSLDMTSRLLVNDYKDLISSREWSQDASVNYQLTGKITVGPGVTFGYRELVREPNQTYEQFSLRAGYVTSGKTQVHASLGGELHQYGGPGGSEFAPVAELGANYKPIDPTTITLQAYQRDQNSVVYLGQNYSTTGFDASIRQRFLHKTFFTAGGGYENLTYHAASAAASVGRRDNYYVAHLDFQWTISRHWTVGAFFQHRENNSNIQSFSNNQIGLHSAFTF